MGTLLHERCDPFGAESSVRLAGGLFADNMVGKIMWHCAERAEARYRMICTGGDYGFTRSPGQGIIAAYHCPGGHKGQVMPLCPTHAREFTVGPPRPGFTADKRTPYGQVGGTKANEMCPACAAPPDARPLMTQAETLNQEMSVYMSMGLGMSPAFLRLQSQQDQVRAALDELHERGLIHKCPLKLVEVS
jgi:hypothetical protein